jgi:hypothetical protein
MMTAYTMDIDEVDDAVAAILGQISLHDLGAYSVGILSCHHDFIETGVVRELAEKLPFDLVGMTSLAGTEKNGLGEFGLFLTILTSDDARFETVSTAPLSKADYRDCLIQAYRQKSDDPALIITYIPYFSHTSGVEVIKTLDKASGGIPIWGSVATGSGMGVQGGLTIHNKETSADSVVMLFFYGNVKPEFVNTALPDRNIREKRIKVTDSEGCVLKKVDGIPFVDYVRSLGIVLQEANLVSTPVLIYRDSANKTTPVAAGMYTLCEDGSVLCGSEVPEGASVSIGLIDRDGILETTAESIEKIKQIIHSQNKSCVLMISCITRYFMLAPNKEEEMRLTADAFMMNAFLPEQPNPPFMLTYSGGEVCPVMETDGAYHNRFHNYTFSALVL